MIGVVANEAEHRVVVEFFELFKTPWEFHRPGAHYDILICSNSMVPKNTARLLFLYGAQRQAFEECRNIGTALLPDTISFLFAASEYRFRGAAFCLTVRATKLLLTN